MSELISGLDVPRLVKDGVDIQYRPSTLFNSSAENKWVDFSLEEHEEEFTLGDFINRGRWDFRLKPRTITINGIEVPAPAEDEDYHHQGIWILNSLELKEYGYVVLDITDELPRYWWRSKEEIKQVISGLRQVFGGSHDN